MRVPLDTHMWLWWLTGSPQLTASERLVAHPSVTKGGFEGAEALIWHVLLGSAEMFPARVPIGTDDWGAPEKRLLRPESLPGTMPLVMSGCGHF